ncbi:MAG: DUF5615 family PIN-like protein [Bacillota bacterium]
MGYSTEKEWKTLQVDKSFKIPTNAKKLRLFADQNIPMPIILDLRSSGLLIDSVVEAGFLHHPDENIYKQAKKRNRILLTMDRDFWSDEKHSLQQTRGIIFLDIPPDQKDKAIEALARFWVSFAKYYPHDWWQGLKARVSVDGFVLKYTAWNGKVSEDEYRVINGQVFTRKIK